MSITYTNEYSVTLTPAGSVGFLDPINDEYMSIGDNSQNIIPLYFLKKNHLLECTIYVNGYVNVPANIISCEIINIGNDDVKIAGGNTYNIPAELDNLNNDIQTNYDSTCIITNPDEYSLEINGTTVKQNFLNLNFTVPGTGNEYDCMISNDIFSIIFGNQYICYNNNIIKYNYESQIDFDQYKTVDSNNIIHVTYTNTTDRIVPIFIYLQRSSNQYTNLYINKTITPLLNITYDLTTFNLPVNCQFTTNPQLVNADSATITLTGSLPAGLSFDNATGNISGIPNETINTSVTVTISKDGLTVDVPLTFNIVTATSIYQSEYVVDDGQIISPVNNVNYLNGVVTYNVNTPEGIIFNSSNLQIQINSLETQSILNISVTESLEHTTLQYSQTVTINKILTFVYPSNSINIPANNFTNVLIKPTVNRTNYNVTINSGTLPTGLTLLTNGNITNTNTSLQLGTYTIQVKCIDEINTITTTDLTINVVNSTDMYEYTSTNTLIYEINTSVNISPYKLLTGFNNTFTATNLPSFLNINNGVISGVVDSGVYVFSVECESVNSDQTIVYNFVNEIKLIVRKSRLNVSIVSNIVEYYS